MHGLIVLRVTSAPNETQAIGYFGLDELDLALKHADEWLTIAMGYETPYTELHLQIMNTEAFDAMRAKLKGKPVNGKKRD